MAATFDLLSAEYGWTDADILDLPLRRIRQAVAAIQARRWALDLAHRRLETAKLRTLASYIACGYDIAEGFENKMLMWAPGLALGDGCGNPDVVIPDTDAPPAPAPADAGPVRIGTNLGTGRPGDARRFRIPDDAPDAPAPVRAGQPAPMPAGIREVPAGDVGRILRGLG